MESYSLQTSSWCHPAGRPGAAGVENGDGPGLADGVGTGVAIVVDADAVGEAVVVGNGVEIVSEADAAGEAVGDTGVASRPGVVVESGVLAQAARRTARRRDAARRFVFIRGRRRFREVRRR